MRLSGILRDWKEKLPLPIAVIAIIGAAIAIGWFLNSRNAALLLGVLAGAVSAYLLMQRASHSTKLAVLWMAIGVTADAAYAKLNDQAQVTVANALIKLTDGFVKLADAIIRDAGVASAGVRGRIVISTQGFVWALILSLIVFMWLGFLVRQRS